jgi:hypothetical protein
MAVRALKVVSAVVGRGRVGLLEAELDRPAVSDVVVEVLAAGVWRWADVLCRLGRVIVGGPWMTLSWGAAPSVWASLSWWSAFSRWFSFSRWSSFSRWFAL